MWQILRAFDAKYASIKNTHLGDHHPHYPANSREDVNMRTVIVLSGAQKRRP